MALALAALAAGVLFIYFKTSADSPVRYLQLTFRRGQVSSARFAPQGRDIVYSARWENRPDRTFVTNIFSPEARVLGFSGARLVSVSSSADLLLLESGGAMPVGGGEILRVPMNGSTPVSVAQGVMAADWMPGGLELAIVRAVGGANQVEFPLGKVLYRTPGWISGLRVSPHGDSLAFLDHPVRHDTAGTLKILDRSGAVRALTGAWQDIGGVDWHPQTGEIWFTPAEGGLAKSLWAVTTGGKLRSLARIPGTLTLRDIASDGRVLVTRDTRRLEITIHPAESEGEQNVSLLDQSRAQDISEDGKLLLFDESGEAAKGRSGTYIFRLEEGASTRLGDGLAMALSPDGSRALTLSADDRMHLRTFPVGAGEPRDLRATGLEYQWVRYFPDGQRLLALANEPGKPLRLYVQPLEGKPLPISPPVVTRNVAISPDGAYVPILPNDGPLSIYPVIPGPPRIIPSEESLAPVQWSRDGRFLFVQNLGHWGEVTARISKVDLRSGKVMFWRNLSRQDSIGINAITRVLIAAKTETVVLTSRRDLSELFAVDGLR